MLQNWAIITLLIDTLAKKSCSCKNATYFIKKYTAGFEINMYTYIYLNTMYYLFLNTYLSV